MAVDDAQLNAAADGAASGAPAAAMEAAETPPTRTWLCKLFPNASAVLLDDIGFKKIAQLALLNEEHFQWIRAYFEQSAHCLNIKLIANKFCLSRKPCDLANYTCGHRQIKQVDWFLTLVEMGLIKVHKVFVEVHAKPRCVRLSMHTLRKLLEPLENLTEVYVDVSQEEPYVKVIKTLLERSADTLQAFYVRRQDVDTSQLNFRRFLNVSKFGFKDFPVRSHYVNAHQQKQAKKRAERAEKAAHDAAVVNAIQELELIFPD